MVIVWATKFGIHTGAAILPAGGTPGVAIQPDRCLDEASCKKKRAGDCGEYFHFTAVQPWPGLAHTEQYEREDN